ncbi:MAG: hypothetical protein Q9170_004249 [Blastenia crenularia]
MDGLHTQSELEQLERRGVLHTYHHSASRYSLNDFVCLLSPKCQGTVKSPLALMQHLEKGVRHSGKGRCIVGERVREKDLGNKRETVSTSAPRPNDSSSPIPTFSQLLRTTKYRTPDEDPFTFASQDDQDIFAHLFYPFGMDGGKILCPLCAKGAQSFKNMQSFRSHLKSLVHAPKVESLLFNATSPTGKAEKVTIFINEELKSGAWMQHAQFVAYL